MSETPSSTAPTLRSPPMRRAGRRGNLTAKAAEIRTAQRAQHLGQPEVLTTAYTASVRALVTMLTAVNTQITVLQGQVEAHFGRHPATEIIRSQPGLGTMLGARVLAEFGDEPTRYVTAKARRNYAATSPITRASGKKKVVTARFTTTG